MAELLKEEDYTLAIGYNRRMDALSEETKNYRRIMDDVRRMPISDADSADYKRLRKQYSLNTPYLETVASYRSALSEAASQESNNFIKLVRETPNVVIAATQCDANGHFSFKNIPYGNYGIITFVTWDAGGEYQGGLIGTSMKVNEKLQKVIVTQ